MSTFNYDNQIERFVAQFIRLMSGYQVEFGNNRQGVKTLQQVPVWYGDGSRQVAAIIANNSENSLTTVPAMTVYINGLTYDRERVQEPTHVSSMNIRQRTYDEMLGAFTAQQGTAVTVDRLMPVPYILELKLDIWTSNTKQKLQLIEQILPSYNPGMEIQSTDNYIDWTSLSVAYVDGTNWTSRTVPIGTDNPIDVATITFKLPIWISAPAKIKKMGVIKKIISTIHEDSGDISASILSESNLMSARQYFTPLGYSILLINNTLTLLKIEDIESPREPNLDTPEKIGTPDSWSNLINLYGNFTEGISQIRLSTDGEDADIVGTVQYHPTDDTLLMFNVDIDTYPANTLPVINAIINPLKSNVDTIISAAVNGTRYLILSDIGSAANPNGTGPVAWRNNGADFIAKANDIIEFNGVEWHISFDSAATTTAQYVSNLTTGVQYKWNGTQWNKSFAGEYKEGLWSLVI